MDGSAPGTSGRGRPRGCDSGWAASTGTSPGRDRSHRADTYHTSSATNKHGVY